MCFFLKCTRGKNHLLRMALFFMELIDYILVLKKLYSEEFLESQILEAEPILSVAIEEDTRQE